MMLSHEDLCCLGRVYNEGCDLRSSRDVRVNEWLKEQISAARAVQRIDQIPRLRREAAQAGGLLARLGAKEMNMGMENRQEPIGQKFHRLLSQYIEGRPLPTKEELAWAADGTIRNSNG